MTSKEFLDKFHIHFDNVEDEIMFLTILDDLYLQFTKEQVIEIVTTYYDNADDIFNDRKESLEQGLKFFEELIENK